MNIISIRLYRTSSLFKTHFNVLSAKKLLLYYSNVSVVEIFIPCSRVVEILHHYTFFFQNLGAHSLGDANDFVGFPGKGLKCTVTNIDISNTAPDESTVDIEVQGIPVDQVNIPKPNLGKITFK